MEEASERWRAERRRLNAEIDKLEGALADVKSEVSQKRANDRSPAADPRAIARIQEAADQKIKKQPKSGKPNERTELQNKPA